MLEVPYPIRGCQRGLGTDAVPRRAMTEATGATWSAEEQQILEESLRSIDQSSIAQYAIIANRLPNR